MATKTLAPAHSLLVYKRGLARVRPYPFHAVIDEMGVILGATSKKGAPGVQTQKPEDQAQVAPTDFGENATNPVFGRTQSWRTFHLGMGLAVEDADPTKAEGRYRWAVNYDASISSRIGMKGPDIPLITPPVIDDHWGVPKFFDLKGNLYWINGRYLMRLDDDQNATMVGDFGANHVGVDVSVFASNGLGGAIYAYIAVVDTTGLVASPPPLDPEAKPIPPGPIPISPYVDTLLWRFDGTTLVQNTSPLLLARNVVAIGRQFYRANNVNQISVVDVDTDPWVFDNWGPENQFIIGDKSSAIMALIETATGVLLVLKTDGVYSVPADPTQAESIRYFPFLKFGRSYDNGVTWGVFMNDVYVRYGESLYRITPDMTIQEVGPNRAGTIDGPVRGRTTAFAGHGNFHGYTGMWNPDFDTAFLMKYGAHQTNERGEPERIEAWHGSISVPFPDDRITQLYVSGHRAPQAHNRMYIGFRSGRVGFFVLPCVPDPAGCDEYHFSSPAEESYLVMPNWHGGFPSSPKTLRYAAVGGDNLATENNVTLDYRLNPVAPATLGDPWTTLAGRFDTTPIERIDFPDGTQCLMAAFRIVLHNSVVEDSPLATSFSLRWRLISDFTQVYSMIILAEDGLICRDGTPLRRGALRIREHVRGIVADGRIVRLILPDEDIKLVSIIGYGEAIGWYERQERWASGIKIQVAEDSAGGEYGKYKRLNGRKYRDLNGLKYRELNSL